MHALLATVLAFQDPLDEVRERLKVRRVAELKVEDADLDYALRLLSDSVGYSIVVAAECKDAESTKVNLTENGIAVGAALRKLLDPLKLALVFEDGELVVCPRDDLNRAVEVEYHPMNSLLAEPPGGFPRDAAEAAAALDSDTWTTTMSDPSIKTLEVEMKEKAGVSVNAGAPKGEDYSELTIKVEKGSVRDALAPVLREAKLELLSAKGKTWVMEAPKPPRGLEAAVRQLARRTVTIAPKGAKNATLEEVIKAVGDRCELAIEIDEDLLKSVNAPPKGAGGAPASPNGWETLRASAAARGLGLEWRAGRMHLKKFADLKAFTAATVRPAVNLLDEK